LNNPIKIATLAASDAAENPAVYIRHTLEMEALTCMNSGNALYKNYTTKILVPEV
jgi:hypothetical protein